MKVTVVVDKVILMHLESVPKAIFAPELMGTCKRAAAWRQAAINVYAWLSADGGYLLHNSDAIAKASPTGAAGNSPCPVLWPNSQASRMTDEAYAALSTGFPCASRSMSA